MNKHEIIKVFINQTYTEAENKLSNYKTVCKKGCSHCCYQPIEIACWEVINMVDYIRNKIDNNTFNTIQENIKRWAIFFNKFFPDIRNVEEAYEIFRNTTAKHVIPCPFLISNICSIYQIRPLACRVHAMNSDAQKCKDNPLRQTPPNIGNIGAESFIKLISAQNSFVNYLPILLQKEFRLPSDLFKPHAYLQL